MTATKRAPGLSDDSVLLWNSLIASLESRVQLDLIEHRNDPSLIDEPLEMRDREVEDTDRSSTAFLPDLLKNATSRRSGPPRDEASG